MGIKTFVNNLNRKTVNGKIQVDNEHVRVTEYHFIPGAETKFHKHIFNYVVIPVTDGELLLINSEGEEIRSKLTRSLSYFRNSGVEHNVINVGKKDLIFIELEIKGNFKEKNKA